MDSDNSIKASSSNAFLGCSLFGSIKESLTLMSAGCLTITSLITSFTLTSSSSGIKAAIPFPSPLPKPFPKPLVDFCFKPFLSFSKAVTSFFQSS